MKSLVSVIAQPWFFSVSLAVDFLRSVAASTSVESLEKTREQVKSSPFETEVASHEFRELEIGRLIVFSALLAAVCARPSLVLSPSVAALAGPVTIARLVPGAPIGLDGRVVDTPEVTLAKAEHAAAHINERINLANEALKSADLIAYAAPVLATRVEPLAAAAKIVPPAPLGPDGRVVDTPEVALAKAEHAAAHINEKLEQAARGVSLQVPIALSYTAPVIQKLLI
ncbi:hypothetical protein K0M31_008407 [Melipona bicolor]|uniref:Cuticle protein 18.7-like n=1 Tax=Melipona bicolor TaxID=60889 RepID=A0AA40FRI9_9HYME|nr:hypothetical protein K0M31_008407 [Melipona bicolor]